MGHCMEMVGLGPCLQSRVFVLKLWTSSLRDLGHHGVTCLGQFKHDPPFGLKAEKAPCIVGCRSELLLAWHLVPYSAS